MAKQRPKWASLLHSERIEILARYTNDQIIGDYAFDLENVDAIKAHLSHERELWKPQNLVKFKEAGKPPTKDVVLGAYRDLDRAEALLELIDNSIDAWLTRRGDYPDLTAKELRILIRVDEANRLLVYLDNAGGVSTDRLENLVVPGCSDTTAMSNTIGSYKTGGKKAVFRLATAAHIETRYWNPAGSTDKAVSVQLDSSWMNDPDQYRFSYTEIKDKGSIEEGQTRYTLELREEPKGGEPWYSNPESINKIIHEIRTAYSLLLIRIPEIKIYFINLTQPIEPDPDLFDFSMSQEEGVDIRPQLVVFDMSVEHNGTPHPVQVEVVLGCRTTSGSRDGRSWGIDIYGNNRLFVAYDKNVFASLLPAGGSKNLIRGYVNVRGPNVFVPWDTHKRHINMDSEITRIVTHHPAIRELFANWKKVYNDISGSGRVTELINPKSDTKPAPIIDKVKKEIAIPHTALVKIAPARKRKAALPTSVHVPHVAANSHTKENGSVTLRIQLTMEEARTLAVDYGVEGELTASATISDLSAEIKIDLMKRSARRRKG